MLLSLILSTIVTIPPSPPTTRQICRDALQWKDENLPANSTSDATDVAHVTLVYGGDRFAGLIYVTRAGDLWYEAGTPKAAVDESLGRSVVDALGFPNRYHQQTFYKLQPTALRALVTSGKSMLSCY
jgi:hypothetical protein